MTGPKSKYLVILLACPAIWFSFSNSSWGQLYNLGAFWRVAGPYQVAITTTAQSLNANQCSGLTTVQTQYKGGAPYKVNSNFTVNLNGNGFLFFSDSGCTTPIWTVTIPNQQTSASFYFTAQATNPILVSGSKVVSGTQTETIVMGTAITGFGYIDNSYTNPGSDFSGLMSSLGNMTAYNGNLYASLSSNVGGASPYQFVYVYNGNDAAPSWSVAGGVSPAYGNGNMYYAPQMISYGGFLFAIWSEANGGKKQIRVKKFDGTNWIAADSGTLNVNAGEDADNPVLGAYAGNLYATWNENGLIHVAQYGGGTAWSRIDDNGSGGLTGTSMNYSGDGNSSEPSIWGTAQGLFEAWGNTSNQVRVKLFNGTSWAAADGGSGIQFNGINTNFQFHVANFATINGETYATWYDGATEARVAVFAGGTTWNGEDGGTGLFSQTFFAGSTVPTLLAFQNRLYAIWSEYDSTSNVSYSTKMIRMAVYNGNDGAPAWTAVGTPGADGLGYIPWEQMPSYDGYSGGTIFNNKLYGGFWDSQGFDTTVFTQSTAPAKFWLPSMNFNDQELYQTVNCTPDEVRTVDASGRPSFATSPVTVTLSGTGIGFFADDFCSIPLTSNQVTVNAGDSGAHFFFLVESGGDVFSIGASGGGLTAGNQSLNNGDSIWVGGLSCDHNWTTPACWSGNTVPGNGNTAVFSGSQCTINCDATINTSDLRNLLNLFLEADYTGTVTQATGTTPTVNGTLQVEGGSFTASSSSADTFTAGDIFLDGTGVFNAGAGTINAGLGINNGSFNAGTATISLGFMVQTGGQFNSNTAAISENGNFIMTGGTFNAPSGNMFMGSGGGTFTASGTPTFNTNGGTITFNPTGHSWVIASGPVTFNNVTFAGVTGSWWAPITIHGTMNIGGNMVVNNDETGTGGRFTPDGPNEIIAVAGNVTGNTGNSDYFGEDTANLTTLELVGSGVQNFSETDDCLPGNVVIASTGQVNMSGTIHAEQWTYTSGNVVPGTSLVEFFVTNAGGTETVSSGAMHFNDVLLGWDGFNWTQGTVVGTMYVDGNLTITTPNGTNGGVISLAGNLNWAGGGNGTAGFIFTGGNAQTFTSTVSVGGFPSGNIVVTKTPGTTLTLNSELDDGGNFTVTTGTVNLNGNLLTVQNDITINDSITSVGGSITGGGSWTNNGTFFPGGGIVTFTNSSGENPATIGGGIPSTFYVLTIAGGNPIQQNVNLTVNQGFLVTSGTYNANASTLTIGGNFSNKATFNAGTSSVVLASGLSHFVSGNSTTFYNLTMDDSGNSAADTVTFLSAKTYTVTNLLTLKGNATNNLSLRSSIPGTQWKVNPTSYAIADVDVEDSNNTNAATIAAGTGSQDSGNNTKWSFVTDDIWIGGGGCDGNWTTPGCWSAGVPTPSSVVDFNNTCTAPCSATINAAISVHALYLDSAYAGTVTQASGKSVTVASEFNVGKGTFTASTTPGDTISAGSIVVDGGTLNGQSATFTDAGNWVFGGGTFNAQTSTVIMTPGASHTIYGTSTFNNLTMDDSGNSAADTLSFASTFTTTVSGTLTLKGNATNDLALISTVPGAQWKINPSGTRTISAVSVQDSDNTNAAVINVSGGSIGSGDNTKWTFGGVSQVEAVAAPFASHVATANLGTSTTAGELIVVTAVTDEDNCVPTGVTDSSAGTYSVAFSTSVGLHLAAAVYYRQNAPAGITSVSVTECATSSSGRIVVGHYKGLATSGVLDVFSSPSSSGTPLASWSSGAVTTTAQPELMIGAAYAADQGGAGTCTMSTSGLWGQDVMVNDGGVDGANGGAMLFGHEFVTSIQPSAAFTGATAGCGTFTTFPFIVTFQ